MELVYIETSIVSHATARPSKEPSMALLQIQARQWMAIEAPKYQLVISQLVIDESSEGDPDAVARRMAMLESLQVLPVNPDVELVADELIGQSMMPQSARLDALHVAAAALAGVQYLLTQNCRHIANAHILPRVYQLLAELGLTGMLICTPDQFLGGSTDDEQPNLG